MKLRGVSKLVLVAVCVAVCVAHASALFGSSKKDRVDLRDVEVMTFRAGQMTAGRRSKGVPQVSCTGGAAAGSYQPTAVQCRNMGSAGNGDFQWKCQADLPSHLRFGETNVSCEGYDSPDDYYVLAGSCGVEYTLEFDPAYTGDPRGRAHHSTGHHSTGHHSTGHASSSSSHHHAYDATARPPKSYDSVYATSGNSSGTSLWGWLIFAGLCYLAWTWVHKPSHHHSNDSSRPAAPSHVDDNSHGHGFFGNGHSHSNGHSKSSSYTTQQAAPSNGSSSSGPGFWSGAGLGGLMGYMMGNRGSRTGPGATMRQRSPYNSYTRTTSYQQPSAPMWTSSPSNGHHRSPSSSPAQASTRTASGFGGTVRR